MNASNIFTLPNEISSGRKEISHDVKETLSLLKQFYDVPIVKYIDFREVYSEHIITNDDANSCHCIFLRTSSSEQTFT